MDDVVSAASFVDVEVPTNNNDPGMAGQLLFFDSVNGWLTYFAFDLSGTMTPQWTSPENSFLANVGDDVIDGEGDMVVTVNPGAGFFSEPRAQPVPIMMLGMVRSWDFACPLSPGYNFVGSAYPLAQSPSTRNMSLNFFAGAPDPLSADQIQIWQSDGEVTGVEGYESHYRVLAGPYDYWTTLENSSLANEDDFLLFQSQRAVFISSIEGHDKSDPLSVWVWPVPWTP